MLLKGYSRKKNFGDWKTFLFNKYHPCKLNDISYVIHYYLPTTYNTFHELYLDNISNVFYDCFWGPLDEESGDILIYPYPFVPPFGYRYMVCPNISSYSFGATALIFCRMFIHIMEVGMSTGF
jgi:hypothetical protein